MYVRTLTSNPLDTISTTVVRHTSTKSIKHELRDALQLVNGVRRKLETLLDAQ